MEGLIPPRTLMRAYGNRAGSEEDISAYQLPDNCMFRAFQIFANPVVSGSAGAGGEAGSQEVLGHRAVGPAGVCVVFELVCEHFVLLLPPL